MSNIDSLTMTADELLAFDAEVNRCELIDGVLYMMSHAGGRHGRITQRIALLIGMHVAENRLGVLYAAETGFKIAQSPDTVIAADVAYIQSSKFQQIVDETRFLTIPPDLIVEVMSPNDSFARTESKILRWLDAGCRLALLVDPESETVHAYRSRLNIQLISVNETLDCCDVIPQFQISICEFFRAY